MTAFLDVIIWPIYAIGIGAFILALALVAAAVILLIWLAKKRKRTGAPPQEEPLQKEWGGLTEDSLPKKNADLSEENALREEVFSSEDGTSAECAQSEKAERKGGEKK